jgi:putative DNA primase/helicase
MNAPQGTQTTPHLVNFNAVVMASEASDPVDAALAYAAEGLPVFPCSPQNKRPLTLRGFKDATTESAQIREWWKKWPQAMIGVPTGQISGLLVLDVDVDPAKNIDGFATLGDLERDHGAIPDTLSSTTPRGGGHYYFAWHSGIRNSAGTLGSGLDVRGDGGYIILPPSCREDGRCYEWSEASAPIPLEAPEWLIDLAARKPAPPLSTPNNRVNGRVSSGRYARAALERECVAVAAAQLGTRNDTLNRAAFSLFQLVAGGGLSEAEVRSRLYDAASVCGLVQDGGAREVLSTIDSACAAGMSNPRNTPERYGTPDQRPQKRTRVTSAVADEVSGSNQKSEGKIPTTDTAVEAEIVRLAGLSQLQYERERSAAAERLGLRTSVLDAFVKTARPAEIKGQGRSFELPSIEPWPELVHGAELLDDICDAISRYVVMQPESAATLALWALHTHCFNCFTCSPRAAIVSPEKQCGKTTTLDVLSCLVSRPLSTASATPAAIFRTVEIFSPTILMDEADTFLNENNELRGILNNGYRQGGTVLRTIGDDHEPRQFSTWAPLAIAMIGRLPDTLNDRSVIVRLRRRKATERTQSFRSDRVDDLRALARKMVRWSQDHRDQLAAADPDMGGLENRVADNWRPLFAIADEVGGDWPTRARKTANAAVQSTIDQSTNVQLLADLKWIFDGCPGPDEDVNPVDRLASAEIVKSLIEIEGRPWAEWKGGKPITQNGLARQLGKFEILSGTIRLETGVTAKGYYRTAFEDAFSRYLSFQTVTTSQLNNDGHCDGVTLSNPRREAIDL